MQKGRVEGEGNCEGEQEMVRWKGGRGGKEERKGKRREKDDSEERG